MTVAAFPVADAALDALFVPFQTGALRLPPDGRVLFLRARDGFALREMKQPGWLCEQSFKPFAEALERSGLTVGSPATDDRFSLVLLLPPRQRDEARALLARAFGAVAPGGRVVACVPNAEGAKSIEADMLRLAGTVGNVSKHKCRVFWATPETIDAALCADWLALDAPRENAAGYVSRPGLFAWDRIDTASALLAAQLPIELAGRAADLGAGYGYLGAHLLGRCPGIVSLDAFEAEARALEPARANLEAAMRARGQAVPFRLHWHDIAAGVPGRYDAIVSNPPFHQGRADLPELGQAFIRAAADALEPNGRFWMVANRHLPYEASLAERFEQVRHVALQDGFKVIEARGVRR
ncbi:MAG TPA: class I SAM-dependent methyltransferase [Dyella sp.]|uniref:class I SAM-dependent methyltransferase n=1 Tax=Dyella sp. TaxID=1869338 RepID=UPI002F953906